MGCQFISKLNTLHLEEKRRWHQINRKKKTPGNLMYTTLVTRTTHISQQSATQIHSYDKMFPSFLDPQKKCKAYLNSFFALPTYCKAPLPILRNLI